MDARRLGFARAAVAFGAVVRALVGMFAGQATRNRIEPVAFRKWFFVAMVLVGSYMAIKGLAAR